jgi:uroporphyrinogen-III synthase
LGKAKQPLEGKRVVVTRAPEQAGELVRSLEAMGADVLLLPTVGFAPPEDWSGLDAAIGRLSEFDWILFTSQNAVRFFAQRLRERDAARESRKLRGPKIAALGPATAETANLEGFSVDYIAKNNTGEGLASELAGSIGGRKVLLPRSDRGDDRLPSALRESGANVTEVIAYRTTATKQLDPAVFGRVRRAEVDAIVFASPSAFHNLCDSIPAPELAGLSERIQFAAIGPTTARALKEAGVRMAVQANESSVASLADAIAKYYERQKPSAAGHA